MSYHEILDTEQTKHRLIELLSTNDNLDALSAYFTRPAFDWLSAYSTGKTIRLVIRGRPNDFKMGASSLDAVEKALTAGWTVYFHSALHAKVYLFESRVILGSGNLTANGMNLLNSTPNIEINIEAETTLKITNMIASVFDSASPITEKTLKLMEDFLSNSEKVNILDDWWPDDICSERSTEVFCSDFPQSAYMASSPHYLEPWTAIANELQQNSFTNARKLIYGTVAYRWIRNLLMQNSAQAYFGKLTDDLHNNLADDTRSYRRTVKDLLSNFLTFIEACEGLDVNVSRPRYSQLVILKD